MERNLWIANKWHRCPAITSELLVRRTSSNICVCPPTYLTNMRWDGGIKATFSSMTFKFCTQTITSVSFWQPSVTYSMSWLSSVSFTSWFFWSWFSSWRNQCFCLCPNKRKRKRKNMRYKYAIYCKTKRQHLVLKTESNLKVGKSSSSFDH